MKLILSTHNVTLTKAIEDHIVAKLDKLDHFGQRVVDARVTLEHDHTRVPEKQFSCSIRIGVRGPDLFAKDIESDLYAAIDAVVKKIEQQIRKRHEKRKTTKHKVAAKLKRVRRDTEECSCGRKLFYRSPRRPSRTARFLLTAIKSAPSRRGKICGRTSVKKFLISARSSCCPASSTRTAISITRTWPENCRRRKHSRTGSRPSPSPKPRGAIPTTPAPGCTARINCSRPARRRLATSRPCRICCRKSGTPRRCAFFLFWK